MSATWRSGLPMEPPRPGPLGWALVALRGAGVAAVVFGGLPILWAARQVERLATGEARPLTPWITVGVCRAALAIIGLDRTVAGRPVARPGAIVANHVGWLDVFVVNATRPVMFISKAEVRGWPGVGWLARATGTLFIARDRRDVARQRREMAARIRTGHTLVLFPEGTSTDGRRVLSFKTALFDPFVSGALPADAALQPVSLSYDAPPDRDPRFYGWWGDMAFGAHLAAVLAQPRQGRVRVTYHEPLAVAGATRKALALAAETAVRSAVAL